MNYLEPNLNAEPKLNLNRNLKQKQEYEKQSNYFHSNLHLY